MNDLISRQAAIDALHAHLMYRMGTESNKKRLDEWINSLPSAQPTQTNAESTQDCISRQAAIDATWEEPTYNDPLNVLTEVRDRIKGLPSAQTKIIRCKDCKHRPVDSEDTQGFGVKFPDEKCPCQCYEDGWYNWRPDDEWFCANAERREG